MTADALRDRIAEAIESVTHDPGGRPCELCVETADAVLAVLADADPTDIGGRTLTKIQMLEEERDAMQRRTFELAEQVAAVRDDLWGLLWRRLGTARPRTKETPDG